MLKISEEKDPDANSVAQNLNDEEMESLRTENYEKLKAIQSQQMELMDLRSRLASAEDSVQDLVCRMLFRVIKCYSARRKLLC